MPPVGSAGIVRAASGERVAARDCGSTFAGRRVDLWTGGKAVRAVVTEAVKAELSVAPLPAGKGVFPVRPLHLPPLHLPPLHLPPLHLPPLHLPPSRPSTAPRSSTSAA